MTAFWRLLRIAPSPSADSCLLPAFPQATTSVDCLRRARDRLLRASCCCVAAARMRCERRKQRSKRLLAVVALLLRSGANVGRADGRGADLRNGRMDVVALSSLLSSRALMSDRGDVCAYALRTLFCDEVTLFRFFLCSFSGSASAATKCRKGCLIFSAVLTCGFPHSPLFSRPCTCNFRSRIVVLSISRRLRFAVTRS